MDQSTLTLAGYVPTRDEYDRALKVVRALTERVEVLTSELRTQAETSAAQMRELAAARAENASLEDVMDEHRRAVMDQGELAKRYAAERDAARAEVARVTELAITERDSAAREIERLTAALESVRGDVANNKRHLDIVEYINAALRGAAAPAGGEARP